MAVTGGRPRLVVLRALGLGDLFTAVPALRALARAFPDHERLLAAPGPLAPLVPAELARLVATGELEPLGAELHRPEVAVNLHGRGPQSHRLLLAVRPGRALWFAHPEVRPSRGAPRWRPEEYEPGRWCRMLAEQGVPASATELDLEPPSGPPAAEVSGATVIHPGAASAARRWPPERFAAVARHEVARGRPVVITGGPEEVDRAHVVARGAGLDARVVLAGRTGLVDLARVVAGAGRLVCGDTGVAHLATAYGTPSLVLFGPVPPAEWGPPPARRRHRALWAGAPGYRGDPHGTRPDAALLHLTPERVIAALEELPDRDAPARAAPAAA